MSEWTVEQRITDYLASGGLFNPELSDHDAVSRLLFDCRAALAAERKKAELLVDALWQIGGGAIHIGEAIDLANETLRKQFGSRDAALAKTKDGK